ncbi:DUF3696 domain-containing protein [Lutibacter sp. A80]|uniref:AAA family ATPase n=1 Tax=Lutibacter sp. A80 TaxID=2918453 RepID=UPI001F06DEEE|nr:DUF3696 domain-containing protein [Lutibacter sp. A80]UMB60849.1 DUF3696 domain-containing protein [Lutibacter sp. A80]
MIGSITLKGFKSFLYNTINFGGLTVLTGLNSSGKSSVIQAVLMGEQAIQKGESLLEGFGDFSELKNQYSKKLEITAEFGGNECVTINEDEIILTGKPDFTCSYISADRFGPRTSIPLIYGNNYHIGNQGDNITKVIEHFENEIIPSSVKHKNSQGDTFYYNLEAWLGIISPNTKFKSVINKKSDTSYITFNEHRSKNVGFGLSYTLPVIAALLLGAISGKTVIIENPEAHLHPKGQTELARLISLVVEAGSQVIIETHSDHIFDGIRIFAKENESSFNEKIKTYWFELDEKGNTDIQEAIIDENGRLKECPDGLFDQFEINSRQLL